METPPPNVSRQIGIFLSDMGKNLFGIGNGAEFQTQNWVIESPKRVWQQMRV